MITHPNPDYTTYSHEDLLKRVTDLEAQLKILNAAHNRAQLSPASSVAPPKKKPRKEPKPFDPSRYSTRHIALKFAYLGGNYNGFEHHTNNTTPLPTIEEELWRALRKTRLIFPAFKEGQSEDEVCWDGCDYSKCGRTDKGVSAFGQVVGVKVRSARPKAKVRRSSGEVDGAGRNGAVANGTSMEDGEDQHMDGTDAGADGGDIAMEAAFDPIRDELPYIQLLNRVLPPDIKVLAWCANPPPDFSARFNCKERRYRYFFTNPAYIPSPGTQAYGRGADGDISDGWLDLEAMEKAAKKLEGLHDFRNFCKVDASKQISNFERRIFHAGIHAVGQAEHPKNLVRSHAGKHGLASPQVYYFEVRGSAFLWHQVRHLVAIIFLVGQGYEQASIVDYLLDIERCPSKPLYEMASDAPLVLWDCIFPDSAQLDTRDHQSFDPNARSSASYEDALEWIYIGSDDGGRDPAKRVNPGDNGKYGRNGIMDELWVLWRKRKMDEILAASLIDIVARQGETGKIEDQTKGTDVEDIAKMALQEMQQSSRVFDGGEKPRNVGPYVAIARRNKMEAPEVVNERYAARKGLAGSRVVNGHDDMDE